MNAFNALSAAAILACLTARPLVAQVEYRNLEAGRPMRISDASPTERHALEFDLTTFRVDRLSLGRYRAQFEPRISYGIIPRGDISIRALAFYREPSAVPRGTVAGVGIGGEYQLRTESQHAPALGISAEIFLPTGPNAARPSYSAKGLLTRSFPAGRLHINGSYGTYSVKIPVPPPGSDPLIPPIVDGPCTISPADDGLVARMFCMAAASGAAAAALKPGNNTGGRWVTGIGVDKTFPLQSILIAADVFAQRYEGLGRPTDLTAEIGARTQVSSRLVADLSLGRHFKGVSTSWFMTFGTTFSVPYIF